MEMQEKPTESKKDEGEGAALVEVKTEEEAEAAHYDTLRSPTEDVYADTEFKSPAVKTKKEKQTGGNERLYRRGCLVLTAICLILLLVVIILGLKLRGGSCDTVGRSCQDPPTEHTDFVCQRCAKGWLPHGRSCYFLSTTRLSWVESQKNCSSRGGSLAVISSQNVQSFLTKIGNFKYWIGLRRDGSGWNWVNNSHLQESYWVEHTRQGDCALLSSEDPAERNWHKANCQALTYYICQQRLVSGLPT